MHTAGHPHPKARERSRAVRWVCDVLNRELADGSYPDNVLPSEDALIRQYAVSRGIIRQVLDILREQRAIERVRGAGTFILTPATLDHGIDVSRDLAQDVNASGTRVMIRTTEASMHPATAFIARQLQINPRSEVAIIESVTSLDGNPLAVRTAFVPGRMGATMINDPTFTLDRSPYEMLTDLMGEPVGDTELQISSSSADRNLADILDLPIGFPLLDTTRIIHARDGAPLEYSISHARADRLLFSMTMRATQIPQDTAVPSAPPIYAAQSFG